MAIPAISGDYMLYVFMVLIGLVAGLRAMTPLAAVSWGAALGWINLSGTWAAFMGATVTPYILTVIALVELVADQLPQTPSRKVPQQFGARIITGGLSGLILGLPSGNWLVGIVLGIIGAVIGTLGGAELRGRLAKAFGRDLPAALLEDLVAIGLALWIVASLAGLAPVPAT